MPNTRIHDQWAQMVKSIVADHEKWGPKRILDEVRSRAERFGLTKDYPSQRTIQRIKDDITPDERIEYGSLHWPESMDRGDLPWEASASALELLFILHSLKEGRPNIRLAKWFWRVSRAAPDATPEKRLHAARLLSIWEALGQSQREAKEGIEWFFAYAPWRSIDRAQEYTDALEGTGPRSNLAGGLIPSFPRLVIAYSDEPNGQEAFEIFAGAPIAGMEDKVRKEQAEAVGEMGKARGS